MTTAGTLSRPVAADPELPELRTPLPGPKAKAIVERDQRITSPSYTRDQPLVIERGRGCLVWDPDGNRFLDMAAGIAVCATGHSHPRVVEAIKEQAERFLHMSGTDYYYDVQVRLAERLGALAPLKDKTQPRVFFTNSGTEAVEAALKLARYRTRRPNVVSFYGSFHGRTYGSMSLTASKAVQKQHFSPLLSGIYHVSYCNPLRCRAPECRDGQDHSGKCGCGALKELTEVVAQRVAAPDTIAAVIVEPIQGEGGYVVPSHEWLRGLRDFCSQHGIMLIADEVQSGAGRTGRMFAIEESGVQPDIICMAKGIASGLPLGCIIADSKVMTWPYGSHASTFGGNPVACAAAHATLDLLESELMANARTVGAHLKRRLEELLADSSYVAEVRGRGLMIGVEICHPDGTPAPKLRNTLVDRCFHEGMLLLGCGPNTLRFAPPLCLTQKQADFAAETIAKLLLAMEPKDEGDEAEDDAAEERSFGP